jgi:threonine dehydratase
MSASPPKATEVPHCCKSHDEAATEEALRQAQKALWSTVRIVAEPGGAAAFASLLSGRYRPQPHEKVGVLISGGNTTAVDFER